MQNRNDDGAKHQLGIIFSIGLISILILMAIFFHFIGLENAFVFDRPVFLPVLNLVFLFICPMVVGYFAVKGYLASGSMSLIMLGSGVFSLAFGSLIAGFLLLTKESNAVITVHNVSVFLSGFLHLAGAIFFFLGSPPQEDAKKRKANSIILFSGIFIFLLILTFGVLRDFLPVFFVQGQGATSLRQVILGIAILSFFISGLLFMKRYNDSGGRFLYWYATGLFLISIGLVCIFIQKLFGSPIGWLGRIAQYSGGIYLLIAVFSGARESGTKFIFFHRFLGKILRSQIEVLLSERTSELALANDKLQQEIYERDCIEKELKVSEDKFRHIFNHSIVGKSITYIDGEMEANKAFWEMLGYSKEEFSNRKWQDISHPDDVDLSQRIVDEILSGEKDSERFVKRYLHKNGSIIWADVSTSLRRTNEGKPLYLMTMVSNITERKQSEMALINSEHKWRNILVNIPQIGITLNKKAEIIFANTHFLNLTGWQEQEVIGQDWFDMFIPEHAREEVREVFLTVMSQKDTIEFSTYENEIMDRSGMVINVAWSNALTRGGHGNVIDVTCLGVDLTERQRDTICNNSSDNKGKDS